MKPSIANFGKYLYPEKVGWVAWIETKRGIQFIDRNGKLSKMFQKESIQKKVFNPSERDSK